MELRVGTEVELDLRGTLTTNQTALHVWSNEPCPGYTTTGCSFPEGLTLCSKDYGAGLCGTPEVAGTSKVTFKFQYYDASAPGTHYVCCVQHTWALVIAPKGGAAPAPPKDEFTRIGSARVSLSERLKRLARELRPQVEPLLQDRREFDDELPRLRARFQQATAVATALDRKIPPLGEQVERFTAFFRQIEAAERVSPKAVDIQARGSLTRALARLQGRIIEATLAGDTEGAATLQDEFDRDRRQLANLEASLRGQTQKADELLTDLLSQLGALSVQLFAARKEWAQAERTRLLVGDELSRMYTRAALVSERLVALGAKLVALDFDLETVTVTANGKKVYEAQLSGPARKLQALDADIAVMKQALPELEAQRLAALQHFADSQRDAIAALESLAKTIMAVAKKKAAVDFAYNAYDVVRAASKGGLVGALAETAKKVGEALVIFVADKDKTGAKEFESLFNGNVKEAFSADKASRTGVSCFKKVAGFRARLAWVSGECCRRRGGRRGAGGRRAIGVAGRC